MGWTPDQLDPLDDHIREVYAHYGLAMYCAQVLEHELANLVAISRIASGEASSRAESEAVWDTMFAATMGRQLRAVLEENRLGQKQVAMLEEALKTRNFLAHAYFRERSAEFASEHGRNEMIRELDTLRDLLTAADEAVSPITTALREQMGVTDEMIRALVERLTAGPQV